MTNGEWDLDAWFGAGEQAPSAELLSAHEIDPIATSEHLQRAYLRYLRTLYPLRDDQLRQGFWNALDERDFIVKGPILEGAPPFVHGQSIRELVERGTLSREFLTLGSAALPVDRSLYFHQSQAVERCVGQRRNLVIATGTGSGKTESFLLPVLDWLLREREAGTLGQPGVRALLLYPMNALANDQMKRLRQLLAHAPDITFGRYTGETAQGRVDALDTFALQFPGEQRLPNELLSREEMQARPPHILLTNFAMLEYLLLRSTDSALFDGETGRHWRFIVLDEAHTYGGAQGIEIGMLMRRVRDRVVTSERGRLRCIATSATLGAGTADAPAVARFAEALFDEPFTEEDVITARRQPAGTNDRERTAFFDPALYPALRRALSDSDPLDALRQAAGRHAVREAWLTDAGDAAAAAPAGFAVAAWLACLLSHDARLVTLRGLLGEHGPQSLADAADEVFGLGEPARIDRLVDLVALAVRARPDEASLAMLPARYHLFVRALEGAYVCFGDHHGTGLKVFLARHTTCPECAGVPGDRAVFELAVCTRCGSEYLAGTFNEHGRNEHDGLPRFHQHVPTAGEPLRFVLLAGEPLGLDEDDATERDTSDGEGTAEAETPAGAPETGAVPATLCTMCGALAIGQGARPGCQHASDTRNLHAIHVIHDAPLEGGGLRSCLACGATSRRMIVSRLLTGQDAPVSVLATHLYEKIPPARDRALRAKPGEGRKLLVFADSRQDAAFFAPYLARNHQQLLRRRLIAQVLAAHDDLAAPPRIADVANWLVRAAEEADWFTADDSEHTRRTTVLGWLMAELTSWDRRNSLEGAGIVAFRPVRPTSGMLYPPPLTEPGWNLTPEEALGVVELMLDALRQRGIVDYPDGVMPTDDIFWPRNREYFVREHGSNQTTISWRPMQRTNQRLELLERILARVDPSASKDARRGRALNTLDGLWGFLTRHNSPWSGIFRAENGKTAEGVRYRLDHRRWELLYTGPRAKTQPWFVCDTCGVLARINVRGVCPTNGCRGTLAPLDPAAPLVAENNYRAVYETLAPVSMRVEEHTAQWTSARAADIQLQFMKGDLNTLSCSTTFELGVDVGELQAVLLRNVPPTTANYIQRAGRAGRRADSTAFVVTYAQRRSHDLTFHREPAKMVVGTIVPPSIAIDNAKIVRRHVHSVALAAFFRDATACGPISFPARVGTFFRPEEDEDSRGPVLLQRYLDRRPAIVGDALRRIVPRELHVELGIDDWTWVDALLGEHGLLTRAAALLQQDVIDLQQIVDDAIEAVRGGDSVAATRITRFSNIKKTVLNRELLGFFGNANVLPKYSFPVDVVELHTTHVANRNAADITLSRDLRQALTDYAPGSEAVAGGQVWRSGGVRRPYTGTWDTWAYSVCGTCRAFVRARERLLPPSCPVCHEPLERAYRGLHGRYIVPEFGFLASPDGMKAAGESRPERIYSSQIFFTQASLDAAAGNGRATDELREFSVGTTVGAVYQRNGQLSVVNNGPDGRHFRICDACGFAEPAPRRRSTNRPRTAWKPHRNPRSGRECRGTWDIYDLGHTFESDVLTIQLPGVPMSTAEATSTLYALLAGGCALLGIQREDVNGSIYGTSQIGRTLVLFDTVPGGAGHVRRFGERLADVFRAAHERVRTCSCGAETACYECLRTYTNQFVHHELSRGSAERVLRYVVQAIERAPRVVA